MFTEYNLREQIEAERRKSERDRKIAYFFFLLSTLLVGFMSGVLYQLSQ